MKIKKEIKLMFSWVLIATYIFVALSFVDTQKEQVLCLDIDVDVVDTTGNYFIESKGAIDILTQGNFNLMGYPVYKINTLDVENTIKNYPSVKDARAFCSYKGDLSIEITQRRPILRVINYNGESYYIDETGAMMQWSPNYTAKVLVASGNINEPFESRYSVNVEKATEDDEFGRGKILSDLYKLALVIDSDDFWKAEIQQIYIDENSDIIMIPIVGIHKILFGSLENYEKKFRKLKQFYKTGITKKGWNKYSQINLKYENQIVCTKK